MPDVNPDFLEVYDQERMGGQIKFYESRIEEYSRANRQGLALRSVLLFGAAVCGILGGADIARVPLGILAAVLAALSAAVMAWSDLVGFSLNLDLYTNARAALAHLRPGQPGVEAGTDEVRQYVTDVEAILLGEVHTWAQKWQQQSEKPAAE